MRRTVGETIAQLHHALRDYIEAAYHIGDPELIRQRRALLNARGVIHQEPFIESTPRYRPGRQFEELGLGDAATEILLSAAESGEGRILRSLKGMLTGQRGVDLRE